MSYNSTQFWPYLSRDNERFHKLRLSPARLPPLSTSESSHHSRLSLDWPATHWMFHWPSFWASLGCNLKNDRMISVHFQGKPFSITVIHVYAPTSSAEEAEAEQFYEDLQNLLELTPKKDVLFKGLHTTKWCITDSSHNLGLHIQSE